MTPFPHLRPELRDVDDAQQANENNQQGGT